MPDKFRYVLPVLFLSGVLLSLGCRHHPVADLQQKLREADSIDQAGDHSGATTLYLLLRPKLGAGDTLLCEYYGKMSERSQASLPALRAYADSAIGFFSNQKRIAEFPDLYALAELRKGDADHFEGNYLLALTHYFRCQEYARHESIFASEIASNIAEIYYAQANYKEAARYWAQSYRITNANEKGIDKHKFFYLKQGRLNNTGFCYAQSGMIDSALWYYKADLAYILSADTVNLKRADQYGPLTVVYDNLGGLAAKQGDLKVAEDYLIKSLSFPVPDNTGIHIPPLLKLTELYLRESKLNKVPPLFRRSRNLINRFYHSSVDLQVTWEHLYAKYLYQSHQFKEAYVHQNRAVSLHDSIQLANASVNHIDINRELNSMHQEGVVDELRHENALTKLYVIGISTLALLVVIIGGLIYRNLKRTRVYNLNLKEALAEVERANKNYIRIMRVMAHDIINPLAGITGVASVMLLEDTLSPALEEQARLIETSGLHALAMVKELLTTGLGNENEQMDFEATDLNVLLRDSTELLRFQASEKQQKLLFQSSAQPVIAVVNREKIWRVINNIVGNAIKFTPQNGELSVRLTDNGDTAIFSVADNGIGIADKDRELVFEMFTPAKKIGTSGEQPFGLGLSICKKIVEKHRGQIWFETNESGGTTFFVKLPKTKTGDSR